MIDDFGNIQMNELDKIQIHCYHQWDKETGICKVCGNILHEKEHMYDSSNSVHDYDAFLGRTCKFYIPHSGNYW